MPQNGLGGLQSAVGRAIVDNDDLEVAEGLPRQRFQKLRQEAPAIVARHTTLTAGLTPGCFPSCTMSAAIEGMPDYAAGLPNILLSRMTHFFANSVRICSP